MVKDEALRRYRSWYSRLLRLYTPSFYERFGEGMAQTFNDLLRERAGQNKALFGFVAWLFAETSAGIFWDNLGVIMMQKKSILRMALATLFILLLPLVAMQFTNEVNWGPLDFIIAGILLFGAGLTFEFVVSRSGTIAYRAAVGLSVAAGLLLIWINLAVGLIGNEENPANLVYLVVLVVGFIGAVIARLRPAGMARGLFATAVAQALATIIALFLDARVGVLFLNAFFLMLFVAAALLFRSASHEDHGVELTT